MPLLPTSQRSKGALKLKFDKHAESHYNQQETSRAAREQVRYENRVLPGSNDPQPDHHSSRDKAAVVHDKYHIHDQGSKLDQYEFVIERAKEKKSTPGESIAVITTDLVVESDRNMDRRHSSGAGGPAHPYKNSGERDDRSSNSFRQKGKFEKWRMNRFDRQHEELYLQTMSYQQQRDHLVKTSHFTVAEIENLLVMFTASAKDTGKENHMTRLVFRDTLRCMFGITDDIMLDQIYHFVDADQEGYISFTEFLQFLSLLLRGNLEDHIHFCYTVYDMNGDGSVEKTELLSLVYNSIMDNSGIKSSDNEIHEEVREVAELLMKKLDVEKTGAITAANFREAVLRDPTLLQSLGKCLPDYDQLLAFNTLYTDDIYNFSSSYSLPQYFCFQHEKTRFGTDKIMAVHRFVPQLPHLPRVDPQKEKLNKKLAVITVRNPHAASKCISANYMMKYSHKQRRSKKLDSVLLDQPRRVTMYPPD